MDARPPGPEAQRAAGRKPVAKSAAASGEERISGAQSSSRSESAIRVNRWNAQQIVAAANDIAFGGEAQFYSADAGSTWGQTYLPLVGTDAFQADPTVDWTSDGTAWSMTIGVDAHETVLTLHAFKSTDGGATWTYDSDVSGSLTDNDKDMMWVDHSAASPFKDNIYVTWHPGYQAVVARRTGPQGAWQTPVQVSGAETTGTAIGGDVKTNAFGDVFAFYPDTGSRGLYVAKSTDGGASFGTPVKIATTYGSYVFGIPEDDSRKVLIYIAGGAYRTSAGDHVYVVWNDLSGDPGCTSGSGPGSNSSSTCKSRIFFSRSTDGGATWSAPFKISNPPGLNDQFLPWLAVDETSGNLAVTYYDSAGEPRTWADVYYQSSTDGGFTWNTPIKVTSAPTNETLPGADFGNQYGDYTGLDGISGRFFPSWTDRRSGGREEIWTASVLDTSAGCTPPAPPSGLAATAAGQRGVNLSWDASPGATQYAVYRSTSSGGPYSQVGTSTETAFSDTTVTCGTTHSYVVAAGTGACSSRASSQAQATTAACTVSCTTLYSNDFESSSGISDWSFEYDGFSGFSDWRGIQACPAHSGSHVLRFGSDGCTASYAPGNFAWVVPPYIVVPALATNTRLSFWHAYDFAAGADGGSLGISMSGANFAYVPASAIVSGASYNGTLMGACPPSYSSGAPIFTGRQSSFVNTVVDLDAACNYVTGGSTGCAGRVIYLAFFGITGCDTSGAGWFLDDVAVTTCQPVTSLYFYTVPPCRVFDTREAWPPLSNGSKLFQVTGLCGIPADAKAVSANVTVVEPQAPGFLTLYPGGDRLPPTSTLNFAAGEVRANNAVLRLAGDGSGTITAYVALASGTTNLLLDVNGYFQ